MATKGAPSFSEQAIQLRSDYQKLRDNTNLPGDIIDVMYQSGKKPAMLYWYENDIEQGQCVRIYDIPALCQLSGDILCLRRNLPIKVGSF